MSNPPDPHKVVDLVANLPADKIGKAIARVMRRGRAVAAVALVIALVTSSASAPLLVQVIAWTLAGVAVGALIGWLGGTMFSGIGPAVLPLMAAPAVDELGDMLPITRPGDSDCPGCPVCDARPFETCTGEDGEIVIPPHPQRRQVAELAGWRPSAPATLRVVAELEAGAQGARSYAESLDRLARRVQSSSAERPPQAGDVLQSGTDADPHG